LKSKNTLLDKAGNPLKGLRLLLFIILIVFFIVALELIFRTIIFSNWQEVSLPRFIKHPVYGTFQKPNLIVRRYNPPNYDVINRTNSLGFRDREQGFKEDLAGIWLAGASNSYGGFVEDNEIFSARLQNMGYKAANLSSEGHKLQQQIRVIRHLAQQGYRPHAVIIEMTHNNLLGDFRQKQNDLSLQFKTNLEKTGDAKSVRDKLLIKFKTLNVLTNLTLLEIKSRLITNSAIYAWLKIGINSIPALYKLTLDWGLRADVALADSAPLSLIHKKSNHQKDYLINSTARYLATMRDWVEKNLNASFGVILIPSQHHLNKDRFLRYMKHKGLPAKDYDPIRPYRKSLVALRALKVNVLDMAPKMTSVKQPLSFPDDGHTNALGHKLIAEELAKFLKNSLGLSPHK
jgi:lysophospholipase L1-like esterase